MSESDPDNGMDRSSQSTPGLANVSPLDTGQQEELLRLARATIAHFLAHGVLPNYEPGDAMLARYAGVFVTLRIPDDSFDYAAEGYVTRPAGRLRGCVGHIRADMPLYRAVQESAVKAATRDPRFPSLEPIELPDTHIELSVISPFQRIEDSGAIELGCHGLLIERGDHRGLLLPFVPVSRGWNLEQYLEHLCHKAGLPSNAWEEGATLYTFTAQEFGEPHHAV